MPQSPFAQPCGAHGELPGKEKNWLKTVPGKGFFVILRLYSPTEAFLSQTWRPDDLEEMR